MSYLHGDWVITIYVLFFRISVVGVAIVRLYSFTIATTSEGQGTWIPIFTLTQSSLLKWLLAGHTAR